MRALRVHDILKDRILVSRESAHLLEDALNTMIAAARKRGDSPGQTSIVVDFEDVEGIAPSFLDELLSIFESIIGSDPGGLDRCLVIANPPTRLSLKFEAIARGRGMLFQAQPDGSWRLTDTPSTDE